jgi:RHS repeat-associated protein
VREAVGTADESSTTYDYTPNGLRRSVIDGRGARAELRYDGQDRLSKWVFPAQAAPPSTFNDSTPVTALGSAGGLNEQDFEEYGWDAAGNRTSLRKRDGSALTFAYDALGRMSVKIVPQRAAPLPPLDASQIRDVYYAYDLRGLQTEAKFDGTSGEGVTNAYDGFGRLSSSTIAMAGASRTLAYHHDSAGNRDELTYPDGVAMSFVHDGLGRMTGVREGALGSTVSLAAIGYNSHGERSSLTRRYGDATTYAYDGMARLASLTEAFVGATGNTVSTFAYNPASQITQTTRSNDAYAWGAHYNVDRAYATNGLNQYASAGTAEFAYDSNGNLKQSGSGSQATFYEYDIENRLVSASGASTATLVYDPLGRLFQTSGGSAGTTRFLYDGDELVGEYDANGAMLRRYVHGAGVDDPLVWYEGSALAAPRFLHSDHQGSITGIANGAGQLLQINAYDEYGIPAPGLLGRFAYTGQIWIPELKMYHYKARIYSPTLGRFLQTDPIGYEDQVNLYAYVGDDPLNQTDATGLGKVKLFVETVKGTWKRVGTRKQAVSARKAGKNVDVRGPRQSRIGRQIEEDVSGNGNVTRDGPHPDQPASHRGSRQAHYQPVVRPKGPKGRGHTFITAAAAAGAKALHDAADAVGTWEGNLPPDASRLQTLKAQALDFIDPASAVSEVLDLAGDAVDAIAPDKR